MHRRARTRIAQFFAVASVSGGIPSPSFAASQPAAPAVPPASDTIRTLTATADSAHWEILGRGEVTTHQGRDAIRMDGGSAVLRDFEMHDAVIDLDVSTPAARGFFGVEFRGGEEDSEYIYLRQHKSGLPDALQYTPVLGTGLNWQLYSGEGFTGRVDIPRDRWFHVRIAVAGAQARLFVEDMETPALVIDDLKTGIRKGAVMLSVLLGETYFSNVVVRETTPAPWQRRAGPMPQGTLTRWRISPAYDALARDLEGPLTTAQMDTIPWQEVEAEAPGLVALYRYRRAPHPRVTFQSDFSTRMDPQPGTEVVYARTTIESDRAQVKKLMLGYSDEVSVFLNGQILFRGRSAQSFRDPGFLGIVDVENDAIFLPLQEGRNELVLGLAELGGGWGFVARLVEGGGR